MNETIQAILDRRSIRNFTATPLAPAELDALAEVALASPTAMNKQQWAFRFVTNQALIAALSEAALATFRANGDQAALDRMAARHTSIFYGAPLVILIAAPTGRYPMIDAGIAVQNLAIAAQSLGLGSCIIGMATAAFSGPSGPEMLARMAWPEGYECVISIAIGHPAMTKDAHELSPDKLVYIP
jgi:nitroreductase